MACKRVLKKPKRVKTCTRCGLMVWRQAAFAMIEKATGKAFLFHRLCAEKEVKQNPEKWSWLNPWEVL